MTIFMKVALQIACNQCGDWFLGFFFWLVCFLLLLMKHSEDHLVYINTLRFKTTLGALGLSY